MQRKIWLTCCGMALAGLSIGQIKKQFTVEDSPSCKDIKLQLKANSGNCYIKPSQNPEILNVFSNQTETDYSHTFRKEIKGKTCEVNPFPLVSLEPRKKREQIKSGKCTSLMISPIC